jgi:hypothetical protein
VKAQAQEVYTSLKVPPPQLKIEDAHPLKRNVDSKTSGSPSTTIPTAGPPYFCTPNPYATQHPFPLHGYPYPHQFLPPSPHYHGSYKHLEIPSSDPVAPEESPTLFPHIQELLDTGGCGVDRHNFSQYATNLESNGYTRIFQIADEGETGAKEFAHLCGMTVGIAKLMIKYAIKDCEGIRKKEKRLRKAGT